MSEDYQAAQAQQENQRNPKNRFLLFFCHANDVDNTWGHNWPFSLGVFLFSAITFLVIIYDISARASGYIHYGRGFVIGFYILKLVSDFIALIGICMAIYSICKTSFKYATISYYIIALVFAIHTIFIIYCIYAMFTGEYFSCTRISIIIWALEEFDLLIFAWILFCNMVDIGRKIRAGGGFTS